MQTLFALRGDLSDVTFTVAVYLGVFGASCGVVLLRRRPTLRTTLLSLFTTAGGLIIVALTLRPLTTTAHRILSLDPMTSFVNSSGEFTATTALDNVMLFVPFAAFLDALLTERHIRRPHAAALASSAVLSLTVEALQWLVPTGRMATIGDVLTNTAGAAVGLLLAVGAAVLTRQPGLRVRSPHDVLCRRVGR